MTSGNDHSNEPGRPDPNPDWWQGAPTQEPTWQPPQQPGYAAPQPNPGWQQPGYGPPPTTPLTGGPYGQDYPPAQPQYPPTQAFGAPPGSFGASQGYGAQPGYGQPPGYGQQPPYPPPGDGKRRVWLFAGMGVLVLAIVAAVVVVALVDKNSNEPSAKSNTTPSLISALTSTTAKPTQSGRPTPAKTTGPKATSTPTAVIPGYQVVTIPDNGAAYDIPTTWKVDRTGQSAFGSGADSIPVAGLAQDGIEYCPKYVRTNVFLTQSDETDPAKAAADIGTRMGRIGWSTSTGATPGAPESFQSSDRQLQGIYLETKGNAPAPAAGCASTYSVYTFAFPGDSGAFVFTIAADTGVDQSVDATLAKKILASIRPIQ
ncbi:hypothetical protein [Nocardia aurantiaca]|uniref:DUF8017 domain-containing protein n=1 Tax=Nocardia aurantiaca TaxID=2675850 RepID=A0A6I3KT37_9NOCA|nr:hypothetical protein [Nocardia aurantiaca]MTE12236.1 hypothetical protein [Nocardia aurantiaca]